MKPAFSLFELLVVITVIALLAATLLPAIRMVKESSLSIKCLNNLRQASLGCQAYGTDWKAAIPPSTISKSGGYSTWAELIRDYVEHEATTTARRNSVYQCPNTPAVYNGLWNNALGIGYGRNCFLQADKLGGTNDSNHDMLGSIGSWTVAPLTRTQFYLYRISYPSARLSIADSTNVWLTPNNGSTINYLGTNMPQTRHPGKRVNAVFIDGHVGSMLRTEASKAILEPQKL